MLLGRYQANPWQVEGEPAKAGDNLGSSSSPATGYQGELEKGEFSEPHFPYQQKRGCGLDQ